MSTALMEVEMEVEIEGRGQSDFWFACVDIEVIRDRELSPNDKAVYSVICSHVDVRSRSCPLKVQTIADEAGCAVRTAQESLKHLVSRGVLERAERFVNGKQQASAYRIVGHRAPCYRGAKSAVGAKSDENRGADSAVGAKSAPLGVQNTTPRVLEPRSYENLKDSTPPSPPKGGGGESEPFDLEAKTARAETGERQLHRAIVDTYNETLPELPRATKVTDWRGRAIRARIRDDPQRKEVAWWREFFAAVRLSPWLMGENPDSKGWKADFDWLVNGKNMQKILEGTYSRSRLSNGDSRAQQRKYTDEKTPGGGGRVDVVALLRDTFQS